MYSVYISYLKQLNLQTNQNTYNIDLNKEVSIVD